VTAQAWLIAGACLIFGVLLWWNDELRSQRDQLERNVIVLEGAAASSEQALRDL
jgi:hypothetical protein